MTAWVFLVLFPVLLGGPVTVRVETDSAEQCHRVRRLLVKQLDEHRSNAQVGLCLLGVATAIKPEKETPQ